MSQVLIHKEQSLTCFRVHSVCGRFIYVTISCTFDCAHRRETLQISCNKCEGSWAVCMCVTDLQIGGKKNTEEKGLFHVKKSYFKDVLTSKKMLDLPVFPHPRFLFSFKINIVGIQDEMQCKSLIEFWVSFTTQFCTTAPRCPKVVLI